MILQGQGIEEIPQLVEFIDKNGVDALLKVNVSGEKRDDLKKYLINLQDQKLLEESESESDKPAKRSSALMSCITNLMFECL